MAYKPGEGFLETLGGLSTIRSREKAQAFSEAMGVSQEKRAWEQLQAQVGMFKATEKRLESNAIINAMLSLYGIQKEDDWERLRASQRAEIMNMLPWIKYGAQLNTSMNDANAKAITEEGGSPRTAAMIEQVKQDISSIPPDAILPNGMSAADYTLAMIKKLNQLPQVPAGGKMRIPVLSRERPFGRTDWVFKVSNTNCITNIGANTPEGQELLNRVIREDLDAVTTEGGGFLGIKTGLTKLGKEVGGEYLNNIPINADGGIESIKSFQTALQHILAKLPDTEYKEEVDEKGRVLLSGSPVQDATTVAEAWLHPKGDKNNPTVQRVQQLLAKKGISIDDIPVLTPSQYESVKYLSDFRDQQYNLYNRMPPQDRMTKYGIVNYLQGQTESAQNLYNYIEQEQDSASENYNKSRLPPPNPSGKMPKPGSAEEAEKKEEVAKDMRPGMQRILSIPADRALRGSKIDEALMDTLQLMMADIYFHQARNDINSAHDAAVEMLDYMSIRTETDNDYATYPDSLAPSEVENLFKLLIYPRKDNKGKDTGGFGMSFTSDDRKNWVPFLGKP